MKPKLAIVTGNALKFKELSSALESFFCCEQKELVGYHEIQGTAEEIIRHKLEAAYKVFNEPVLVDDTSVYLADLNGFPGPYMKDFLAVMPSWQMGEKFAGTRITVACNLGVCFGEADFLFAEGVVAGDIIKPKTHDDQKREFDLYVQLDGTDKPLIEFSIEEKNTFSHRGLAIKALLSKLEAHID